MNSKVNFSVIIPFHNRGKYLKKAVSSVLNQTYSDWELVLIDDGSTDNSLEVLGFFSDPRIRILSHTPNRGNAFARNIGWKAATSPWIAFLDSDDWLEPQYLEVVAKAITVDPRIDFCWTRMRYVNERGNILKQGLWMPLDRLPSDTFFDELRIGIGGVCVSKKLFDEFGGFKENLKASVDREFLLRISQHVMGLGIDFLGINILIGTHLSVRKNYMYQSEAYDFLLKEYKDQIMAKMQRIKWWYHKAMWLSLYVGNHAQARGYLKVLNYQTKSLVLFIIFSLFPVKLAMRLHKTLAS